MVLCAEDEEEDVEEEEEAEDVDADVRRVSEAYEALLSAAALPVAEDNDAA